VKEGIGTVEKLAPENMGVFSEILFLCSVELRNRGAILPRPLPAGYERV